MDKESTPRVLLLVSLYIPARGVPSRKKGHPQVELSGKVLSFEGVGLVQAFLGVGWAEGGEKRAKKANTAG